MEATGCEGLGVLNDPPEALLKGSVPPGWSVPSPITNYRVEEWKCDRISWGPFERGPIYIMQETTADFTDPDACHPEPRWDRQILESIWFSDAALVDYARTNFSMPASYAEFTSAQMGTPAVTEFQVAWTPPGKEKSTITIDATTNRIDNAGDFLHRLYWWNGEGISYVDYHELMKFSEADSGASYGMFMEPLLWGKYMPRPEYVSRASAHQYEASLTSTFGRFKDAQCNPL
jgi:hypothetical protein